MINSMVILAFGFRCVTKYTELRTCTGAWSMFVYNDLFGFIKYIWNLLLFVINSEKSCYNFITKNQLTTYFCHTCKLRKNSRFQKTGISINIFLRTMCIFVNVWALSTRLWFKEHSLIINILQIIFSLSIMILSR